MALHAAYQHRGGIFHFRHAARILPWRRLIDAGWRLHPPPFVRTHLVIFQAETIQFPLLRPPIFRRRHGYFLLQGAMHPLVPSVLFRMPGFDPLRHDAQLQPPHRQPRQPGQGRGRPVVSGRLSVKVDPSAASSGLLMTTELSVAGCRLSARAPFALRTRSGFRQQASAPLTAAGRLNFDSDTLCWVRPRSG